MRTVYQASNGVEAHMILNLLELQGLSGRVDGEYLQGGVGELPAAGLVRVMVSEVDYPAAKEIIDKWEATQPAQATITPPNQLSNKFFYVLAGLMLGIVLTYTYYRSVVTIEGIDYNSDGNLDDKWTYSRNGSPIKNEVDRNFDEKVDYIIHYDRQGTPETGEMDDNFDGAFESKSKYRNGSPEVIETDTDGDGYRDFRTIFTNGVISSIEYINPASGYPQKVEYLKLGKPAYFVIDTDMDGKMDQRTYYDSLGQIQSSQSIK